jgi:hypothetical protein
MDLKSSSLEMSRQESSLIQDVLPGKRQQKGRRSRQDAYSIPVASGFARRLSLAAGAAVAALCATAALLPAQAQQTNRISAHVALSASSNEGIARNGATFTAQVAPANGEANATVPTGSVSFVDGEHSLGSVFLDAEGRATLNVPNLTAGEQTVTAVYTGDDKFGAANSDAASVHADASGVPAFTLTSTSSSLSVVAGQTVSTVITATPQNGFNQAVSLSCSGVPFATVTCVFSPAQVTPGAASTANPGGVPVISTFSMETTAYSGGELRKPGFGPPGFGSSDNIVYAIVAPGLLALGGVGLTRRRLQGKLGQATKIVALLMLLSAGGLGLSSCSQRYGYYHHPPEGNPGTPAGTYTVVVTGITGTGSNLTTASVPLTLVVTTK